MSNFIKSKLKSAKELIGKKDFSHARSAAEEVLSYEPENYNANIFLGFALLELGEYDQCEQTYLRATTIQPDQPLAWQGLSKFYEKTEKWDKYVQTLQTIMNLFAKSGDATKCAEQLQKCIELHRRRRSRKELIDSLLLLLPTSTLYSVLSNLPPPDPTAPTTTTTYDVQVAIHSTLPTLEELIRLNEEDEEEYITREVARRRMRLDTASAGPEALRKQIGCTVWKDSKLPELYNEVINHPNTSDELRRSTEAKLLRFKHRYRCALSFNGEDGTKKLKLVKEIQSLIDGVVLLNIPDELAWTIYIEGKDVDTVESYDFDILRRFIELFQESILVKAVKKYFNYFEIPLILDDDDDSDSDEKDKGEGNEAIEEDPFDLLLGAVAELPDSLLAHRLLCDVYIYEEDYQNTILTAEKGLQLVKAFETDTAIKLPQVKKSLNAMLATGLVHLFPPKHHTRAIRVLDDVLAVEPTNVTALMGRAYIHQFANRWEDAADFFSKAAEQVPEDNVETGLVAREEHAWCQAQPGNYEVAAEVLHSIQEHIEVLDGYEERKARVWWRLGQCHWHLGDMEKSYKHFITALKRSPSFAPAFTSLGLYYLEGASPSDPTRATKCFQKAFELDARETEAAKRLAHSFAEERDWDLVEVVVKRTIEGEGGLGGGLTSEEANAIAKHKPTNSWAWKALGVVELNRGQYPSAIQAFQVALRSEEDDALLWLRLGEAYMKAGRHAAALKALDKAHQLQPGDWLCMFLLGEVQRQTGLLSQAIESFNEVLQLVPNQTAVLLSLSEAHIAHGRAEASSGFIGRASSSFFNALITSLTLIESSPGFRRLAFKTIIDALLALSEFSTFPDEHLAVELFTKIASIQGDGTDERLKDIIDLPLSFDSGIDGTASLKLAIQTSSFRLTLFAKDEDGIGSAWFDLGVGLARLATLTVLDSVKTASEKQAIESVRLALLTEPGNASFWNVFGNLNFLSRPMIAQHAYIKALEVNAKDASVWTNLGLLYLHNEDLELANESFFKAQTLDPDYTLAWVGQSLVAAANGHEGDTLALLEHAVGLSADLPAADIEYAYRMFLRHPTLASRPTSTSQDTLLPPFFSLDRYCRRRETDASALHLFGLVCERLHMDELSAVVMGKAISYLEASYEESEDPIIERRYAIANTNLGRILLSTGKLEESIEKFETAFGLLPADDELLETAILRAMCQLGCGIAHFQLDHLEEALTMFESAQEIASAEGASHIRGQITVLLAKVLWEIGSDEFKESAKEQLLACIEGEPENLAAVVSLAAMGLLTDDEALIDAALSEILSLPLEERHSRDPERDIENLLMNHYIAEENTDKVASIVEKAVHAEPSHVPSRCNMASYSIASGRPEVAQALLSGLLNSSDLYSVKGTHEALRLLAVSMVASNTKKKVEGVKEEAHAIAQKSVHMAPWETKNWLGLAVVQKSM